MSSTCPEPEPGWSPTRIIAHRGASGYLPEHTAVAKALAYGLGVDFIEQDLVATRDHELVVLHDTFLDDISDVAVHYPERRRDDGRFYVIDFTLAELAAVSLSERRQPGTEELRFPGRFPYQLESFRIQRFEEEVRLIAGLNASTGGHVGIYPEIKDPGWHADAGVDLAGLIHASLTASREQISGPVFVQSFDAGALRRLRDEFATEFPLVQLLEGDDAEALVRNSSSLSGIADYAAGVGLPFETLIAESSGGQLRPSALADSLANAGLLVHPYTMRRDLPPPRQLDYLETLRFLIRELEVDALFCDHPDDAIAVRDGSMA
ncbi:MAG: glycerophosphodiester phosphodiesterase [Gammaproteobacteria bacterium]